MAAMEIATEDRRFVFAPGEEVRGKVAWQLDAPPDTVSLALLWYTEGRGDQDIGIAETVSFEAPGAEDRRDFRLRLPEGPLSFSGKLISLSWALELVAEPGEHTQRVEILVSVTGAEIHLGSEVPPMPAVLEKLGLKDPRKQGDEPKWS